MQDRNEDNPYRSPVPDETAGSPDRTSGRSRTADLAIVGLVWGTLIGATAGGGSAAFLRAFAVLRKSFVEGKGLVEIAGIEEAVAETVAFVCLGAILGAISGFIVGTTLGVIAARTSKRFRKALRLVSVAASASSGLVWSALLGHVTLHPRFIEPLAPPIFTMVVVILAAAFGGETLAKKIADAAWGTRDSGSLPKSERKG
ncbi:MAG: hypothetical protein ISR77_26655 [Pirellulaceae bacterium]|nr:hypothetical protein [Pirellulaceae bacterium]